MTVLQAELETVVERALKSLNLSEIALMDVMV